MKNLNELISLANSLNPKRLAVVSAEDEVVIEAVIRVVKDGIIKAIFIGDEEKIQKILEKYSLDDNNYQIINANTNTDAAKIAIKMIRDNEADFIMKGLLDTKVLLKEVVNSDTGIKKTRLLSHATVMSYPNFDRLIMMTDGAMNIEPNVEDKISIIENALSLSKSLGFVVPKVGMVSAVEKVNPKIKSTVDAEAIVKYYNEAKRDDLIIDGPFAIDNLVSLDASLHKGITSPVAGKCNILVFPDLVSGNVFYKTSVFLANAEAASIVLGATCPIVLTSRADSSDAKYYSILLGLVYSNERTNICN